MANHFSNEERMRLLISYAESSLTARKYAMENGVSYSTFQRWASNHGISLQKKKASRLDSSKTRGHQQASSACDVPVHFMDITPSIFSKEKEEKPSVSVSLDTQNSSTSPLSSADPLALACQLDVSLPNGIAMTFHQVSLHQSLAMIKALV